MATNNVSSVPLLDLKRQYAPIRGEVQDVINEVCDSQWFVMGPNVTALEEQIAEYSQCEHGIGVSSGTDALLVALMALDVDASDAVITTPYTFFATGGTISRLGAQPIFCDIEPDTYNLDPQKVREFLETRCEQGDSGLQTKDGGKRVRVIMPVHLYGQTADMDAFSAIADEYGLHVIEDAAQSIGSEYVNGERAGSAGSIGCFSFFPSKNLGAFGDAGMCTTRDADLAERLRILRVHGGEPKYYHSVVGGNFRLDALQAAVLIVKLKYLDAWTEGRQSNARYYDQAFADAGLTEHVGLPVTRTGRRHIYNQYIIRVPNRDALREHLAAAGVGTEIYYPVPLHLQQCFASLAYQEGDCPLSEQAANETLAIPVFPELSHAEKDYVVEKIGEFFN